MQHHQQTEYTPRHEARTWRIPRSWFDPAATSIDVFKDARPYAHGTLDVLRSPLSSLIIAGLVDNPAPGHRRALAREASELPVFGATVRALGCAHLQVRTVDA